MSLKECDAITESQEALWVTFGEALTGTGVGTLGVDTSWTPLAWVLDSMSRRLLGYCLIARTELPNQSE